MRTAFNYFMMPKMNGQENKNKEWLQTNNIGGFSSGVVSGAPNRRYHGLLCASLNPPTERHLLVSHLIETVLIDDKSYALSTENYLNHRSEPEIETRFKQAPYAHWDYSLKGGRLAKSIIMIPDENTTLVRYENTGNLPLTLFLKPLLALRNYHSLRTETASVEVKIEGNTVWVQGWGEPKVYLSSNVANWQKTEDWYHQLYYQQEAERGFDSVEKNFSPAELEATLQPQKSLVLKFSTQEGPLSEKPFIAADKAYLPTNEKDHFKLDIARAAKQFLVHRESSNTPSILAGYPWFTDWGRDTLIALRDFQDFMHPSEAQQIIKTFLQYEKNGLIPNRFPDDAHDEIEYNTADATLWLFLALWELQQKHRDDDFLKEIFPKLTNIIKSHIVGTDFGIKVHNSGLLMAGEAPWQLTWMDAKIGDQIFTPRRGCAVEINALWYNALKIYQAFQKSLKNNTLDISAYIKAFENRFTLNFWNPKTLGLYDVIDEQNIPDESIRPNQVYALSLPFTILPKAKQKLVLQQISEKLYTPLGLRTLDVNDPAFEGFYEGDAWARDKAYHQGTVWPFLLREYYVAYEKIYGRSKTKGAINKDLEKLKHHFYNDAGIGSVSEVFDGLSPESGKGCPQQAWSVAALWKLVKMAD